MPLLVEVQRIGAQFNNIYNMDSSGRFGAEDDESPWENASFLSRLTLSWMYDLIAYGASVCGYRDISVTTNLILFCLASIAPRRYLSSAKGWWHDFRQLLYM